MAAKELSKAEQQRILEGLASAYGRTKEAAGAAQMAAHLMSGLPPSGTRDQATAYAEEAKQESNETAATLKELHRLLA